MFRIEQDGGKTSKLFMLGDFILCQLFQQDGELGDLLDVSALTVRGMSSNGAPAVTLFPTALESVSSSTGDITRRSARLYLKDPALRDLNV